MNKNNFELIRYLTEFRKRLLKCLCALFIVFGCLFYFANPIYTIIARPLLKHLPKDHGLIAINIVSPFFVPFELTFVAAIFFCVPFFLYQLWAFIAPALYQHERKLIWPLLCMSTILFYVGVAFAYFIIFPILFSFLTHSAPEGVIVSPDISQFLDFALKLFLVFGIIFEVPVITILLIWTGITTRETLIKIRPYAIVSAFIIGMLFAPPDVISQTLLAIPLWLLFETGILLSRFFIKKTYLKTSKEIS
jgi:sec-independent protein translocase protein TatC